MSFPSFLFLFFLLPIPVIIHILARKYLKKKEYPTLLFLLKNERRLIRWFRLKRILLLMVRIGMLVFFILAASNFLIPFSFFDTSEKIIVDNSLSMKEQQTTFSGIVIPNRNGLPLIENAIEDHPVGLLISDGQRNGFLNLMDNGKSYPGINLHRVKMPENNLAVVNHQIGAAFKGSEIEIIFTILNQYKDIKKTEVSLNIDGYEYTKRDIVLDKGLNDIDFLISLNQGLHYGSIRINDDEGFGFDNVRFFTLDVIGKLKLIIFSGKKPDRLMSALSPSSFRSEWSDKFIPLGDFDFFIADCVDYDLILELQESSIPGIVALNGKYENPHYLEIPDRISYIADFSHIPEFRIFNSVGNIPIVYDTKLKGVKSLIYLESGDIFLGISGNILYLPVSLERNDLSLHPVFIPFLYNIITFSHKNTYSYNVLTGESVFLKSKIKPVVMSMDGKIQKLKKLREDEYLFADTESCGIFKVIYGNVIQGYIAINSIPSESYLDTLRTDEISYLFGEQDKYNGASFYLMISLLFFVLSIVLERR